MLPNATPIFFIALDLGLPIIDAFSVESALLTVKEPVFFLFEFLQIPLSFLHLRCKMAFGQPGLVRSQLLLVLFQLS